VSSAVEMGEAAGCAQPSVLESSFERAPESPTFNIIHFPFQPAALVIVVVNVRMARSSQRYVPRLYNRTFVCNALAHTRTYFPSTELARKIFRDAEVIVMMGSDRWLLR
jgi:hypothetical protein